MKASLALAVLVGLVVQPAHAEQICPAANPRVAPDSRYTVQGDGTVTDLRTGLIWKQCSEGQTGAACTGTATSMTWANARDAGEKRAFAGFSDWRLPNAQELTSLVETGCYGPAINAARFPNTSIGSYWTSSIYAANAASVWVVGFYDGYVGGSSKSDSYGVRLVRGGQ